MRPVSLSLALSRQHRICDLHNRQINRGIRWPHLALNMRARARDGDCGGRRVRMCANAPPLGSLSLPPVSGWHCVLARFDLLSETNGTDPPQRRCVTTSRVIAAYIIRRDATKVTVGYGARIRHCGRSDGTEDRSLVTWRGPTALRSSNIFRHVSPLSRPAIRCIRGCIHTATFPPTCAI